MKKILLLIFIVLTSHHLCGQVVVRLSAISNTSWSLKDSQIINKSVTLSFTSSSIKMHSYYKTIDKAIDKEALFYLSNDVPKTFEKDEVGNNKKGKYLNVETKSNFITYRIEAYNDKEITISRVVKENQVIIGGTSPTTYVKK